MSQVYTIHAEVNYTKHTVVSKTLNIHLKWCVATAEPAKFPSAAAACEFFYSPQASDVQPVGHVWVRGPRGGLHSMRKRT